jgi:hypothetical protein
LARRRIRPSNATVVEHQEENALRANAKKRKDPFGARHRHYRSRADPDHRTIGCKPGRSSGSFSPKGQPGAATATRANLLRRVLRSRIAARAGYEAFGMVVARQCAA